MDMKQSRLGFGLMRLLYAISAPLNDEELKIIQRSQRLLGASATVRPEAMGHAALAV